MQIHGSASKRSRVILNFFNALKFELLICILHTSVLFRALLLFIALLRMRDSWMECAMSKRGSIPKSCPAFVKHISGSAWTVNAIKRTAAGNHFIFMESHVRAQNAPCCVWVKNTFSDHPVQDNSLQARTLRLMCVVSAWQRLIKFHLRHIFNKPLL